MNLEEIYNIKEKVVVLTGAAGTIGREITKSLNELNAVMVLVDLMGSNIGEIAKKYSDRVTSFECDVSDAKSVGKLRDFVIEKFEKVDVLINNHQFKPRGFLEAKAENFPEELWDDILRVNLKGTFLTCRDLGNEMLKKGKGSIINLASTYGVVSSNPALYADNSMGNPLAYSASKGGVVMLTKYLGSYWGARGVRVNCITPHGVSNNFEEAFENRFKKMSPMNRVMQPNEIIGAVVYLASDASSYTNGSNLLVEGGWTAW